MSELPPSPYHPVPEAVRASEGGKYRLTGLRIINPVTGQAAIVRTVDDNNTGMPLIQIVAPNGTSIWTLGGEHIAGYHPEGIRPDGVITPAERLTYNAFTHIVWSGQG